MAMRSDGAPGESAASTPGDADVIRVFLLDDSEIVRRGVRDLLESEHDIVVVGEADTVEQGLGGITRVRPHVALLDVQLPDGNGVEVCREIRSRHAEVQCIMLTSFSDDQALMRAVVAGASGYLLKQIRGSDIVDAVRRVAARQSLIDPAVTERMRERLRRDAEQNERLERLTNQERRILALIAEGMTNRQVAEQLHLAEPTVKHYVSSLLTKLGMERRTQAAVLANRLNIARHEDEPSVGPDRGARSR
jgi:DNA-binding NarL/FixJ family response regulator